jgi:hypothetical protein
LQVSARQSQRKRTRRKKRRRHLLSLLQLPSQIPKQLQQREVNLILRLLNQQLKLKFLKMRKMRVRYRQVRLS